MGVILHIPIDVHVCQEHQSDDSSCLGPMRM